MSRNLSDITVLFRAPLAEGYPQADAETFRVSAYSLLRSGQFRPRLKLTRLDNPRPRKWSGQSKTLGSVVAIRNEQVKEGLTMCAWDFPLDIVRFDRPGLRLEKCWLSLPGR